VKSGCESYLYNFKNLKEVKKRMKIRNILKIIGLACIPVMIIMANISLTVGNDQSELVQAGITGNFLRPGYRPVSDTCPYVGDGYDLNDNFLYKEWCEETFDNGNHIYEAYKNIAFNIEYTPEPPETDFWQTPLETARLKKGDCEDAVFHFFSQLLPKQTNAEIVWGWVIDKRNGVGWAHVWYQLTDKRGQKYVVEGFSEDWNGIIPMDIVRDTETRKPIFTISHCMASRLSHMFPEVEDWQMCQTLVNLFAATSFITSVSGNQFYPQDTSIQLYLSAHEFIEYPVNPQSKSREYTQFLNCSSASGRKVIPNVNKRISNIFAKLHEVFSRYENQNRNIESNIQISHESDMELLYSERNLRCRR
jgi:hypothetical protein